MAEIVNHVQPNPVPLNPLINPSSDYYLHPSENPGAILVSPPLSELNYHSWARAMTLALEAKNKMRFVDGSLQEPRAGDPLKIPWERNNKTILSWIVRTLSPEIAESVMFHNKAADVWTELKQRFSQGDQSRIADLQEEIYGLKQGNLSVTSFYTQLKNLWSELDNFRPITMCACGFQCSCKTYREQDCIMRFLKGLNDQFSGVRSQILLIKPFPHINKVFNMVVQQERQFASESKQEVKAFVSVENRVGKQSSSAAMNT